MPRPQVREEQHESAIDDFRKARAILRAVGHVSSFQGIEDEATLIMKRLSNALSVRLQQPTLPSGAIGSTTRLLLQLEGSEEQLLKEYLSRRRRSLQETLSTFTASAMLGSDAAPRRTAVDANSDNAVADGSADADGEGEEAAADEEGDLPAAPTDVAHLGAAYVPQLVALHAEWQTLFMEELSAPV